MQRDVCDIATKKKSAMNCQAQGRLISGMFTVPGRQQDIMETNKKGLFWPGSRVVRQGKHTTANALAMTQDTKHC